MEIKAIRMRLLDSLSNFYGWCFDDNRYLYTFPEERRDWRKHIEQVIEDAKTEINENVDEAETNLTNKMDEVETSLSNKVDESTNTIHTYIIEAKDEIKNNDNSNTSSILSQIRSWLKV